MIFKRPIDTDEDLTEEEREEKLNKFRENEFDSNDELAMILAALKTFLPPVLLVLALFVLVAFGVLWLWS